MAMPRFARGSTVSALALNQMAQELDYLGLACRVRVTTPSTLNFNTDYIIAWNMEDYDTYGGGMWTSVSNTFVQIRTDGVYSILLQERFLPVSASAPYNTGDRACKILVNSTNVFSTDPAAGPVASAKQPASVVGEGVTLSCSAELPLYTGDRIYANVWQSGGDGLIALQSDYGGTYMSVSRQSALV